MVGATEIALGLYYVDELTTDLWASIDSAVNATTDPATLNCTVNPATARVFRVGVLLVAFRAFRPKRGEGVRDVLGVRL